MMPKKSVRSQPARIDSYLRDQIERVRAEKGYGRIDFASASYIYAKDAEEIRQRMLHYEEKIKQMNKNNRGML